MKKIKVKIKGVAPLLHNRFPEEEHGQNKTSIKKKIYVPKEEAEKKVYKDEKHNLCIPSEHIFGALIKAGVKFKYENRQTYKEIIKGGVIIEPDMIPLGKKKFDEIDTRSVVIQRARVIRWRPKFNE